MSEAVSKPANVSVLFVCLGNICRSPTAHGVFEALAENQGVDVYVDSCGTGSWHVGEPPDTRATAEAAQRGYDLSPLRARQVSARDFSTFDYILAMDEQNLSDLEQMRPGDFAGHLGLFLDFAPNPGRREVPDPYYGGPRGFAEVLDLVEAASAGLLDDIAGAR
ncbi:MAG: low molecular weight protein-tyrosine-phosphatase [Halioglobus sp.]